MTADEGLELDRLAEAHGVFLMEALWMKLSPAMRKTADLGAEVTIGTPRFLQAGLGYRVPPDGPQRVWDAALGGGALFDMDIYTITLPQMFLGPVQAVMVTGTMQLPGLAVFAR